MKTRRPRVFLSFPLILMFVIWSWWASNTNCKVPLCSTTLIWILINLREDSINDSHFTSEQNDPLKRDPCRGWPRGRVVGFACSAACGPVFCWFESCVRTWHCWLSHAEAASHMPQLEGPTTKNIQLCTGGTLGRKRKK